jgi:basic membrane protein A
MLLKRRIVVKKLMVSLMSVVFILAMSAGTAFAGGQKESTNAAPVMKVGMVADVGGLNDHSFNQLTYQGLVDAEKKLGVKGTAVVAKGQSDYVPDMTRFAKAGYNLVIGVGFLMKDAITQVSKEYPNVKFLLIDEPVSGIPNLTTAVFASQQIGFLAGALAAYVEQDKSISGLRHNNTIGVVGGMQIPPVDIYMAGYFQGAHYVDPNITVLHGYTGNFNDPASGKSLALAQHSKGADIVYQLAGGTGLGVIQAAKDGGFYAIGADSNQAYLAPAHVLTSTSKLVNVAVFDTVKNLQNGKFQPGVVTYDLKNHGVDISPVLKGIPKSIVDKVDALKQKIIDGQITVSPKIPDWVSKQK